MSISHNPAAIKELSAASNLPPEEIQRLLMLSPEAMIGDDRFLSHIASLDRKVLDQSLLTVRELYDERLATVKEQHDLGGTIMGGYTLANWILGFMMYPETLGQMIAHHQALPVDVFEPVLLDLVGILSKVPGKAGAEWQRALILFTLPLIALRNTLDA